jgi:hypothetical protein
MIDVRNIFYLNEAVDMIAHDIVASTRLNGQNAMIERVNEVLSADGVDYVDVMAFNKWLSGLSSEEFESACIGEHEEMKRVAVSCPAGGPDNRNLTELLADIWEVL